MGAGQGKRWRKVLAFVGIGGLIVWIIPVPDGPPPWLTIADLAAERDVASKRDVKVQGALVYGSLRRDPQTCVTHFKLADERDFRATVSVRYAHCLMPDALREVPGYPQEITAIGRLQANGHFEAKELLGKSHIRFEMKQPAPAPGVPLVKLKGLEQDPPVDLARALRGTP